VHQTALKAAQGIDTLDLLNHIAWTDVIKPKLAQARDLLTKRLVDLTLGVAKPGEETREQIAGKLFGINFIETLFHNILAEGGRANDALARENLFLQ